MNKLNRIRLFKDFTPPRGEEITQCTFEIKMRNVNRKQHMQKNKQARRLSRTTHVLDFRKNNSSKLDVKFTSRGFEATLSKITNES